MRKNNELTNKQTKKLNPFKVFNTVNKSKTKENRSRKFPGFTGKLHVKQCMCFYNTTSLPKIQWISQKRRWSRMYAESVCFIWEINFIHEIPTAWLPDQDPSWHIVVVWMIVTPSLLYIWILAPLQNLFGGGDFRRVLYWLCYVVINNHSLYSFIMKNSK